MLRRAYEDHLARVRASQQRMLGRKVYRNPADRFEVRERRTAVSDEAPAPDFERGEALYEMENGRIHRAALNSTP